MADRAGQPHEAQIRLPNLMQSSLYHDCSRIDLDSGVVSNNASQTGPAAANANLQLTLRLYKQGRNATRKKSLPLVNCGLRLCQVMRPHENNPPIFPTLPNLPVATEPQAATLVTLHNLGDCIT